MTSSRVLIIDDSPTILKVVQLVLSKAGFTVDVAENGEEGIVSAQANPPDLILLDFVMPKMNGYQVCRALALDDMLRSIPVVLMSAKGDEVGERFVKVMGIVDYITKPFSPEAIIAVVEHTIGKYNESGVTAEPIVETDTALRALQELRKSKEQAVLDVRERITAPIAVSLVEHLAQAGTVVDPELVTAVLQKVLDKDLVHRVFLDALPMFTEADMGPSLHGDLRIVPIAEILQLLDTQEQSGILQVTHGDAKIEVYFRDGHVDLSLATNVGAEFLIGRYMVENDLISHEDLSGFLQSRRPGAKLLGGQLVTLNYISEGELKMVLAEQSRQLIYEMLRWSFGNFEFLHTSELPPVVIDASLALEVEGILMEGYRRVDEWHLIEREISDFQMVFLRNEDAVTQMGRGLLTREELAVLELVNGKNTVKEIIRESRMGSYEVSKMLYRLYSIKLIRKRVMPVAV